MVRRATRGVPRTGFFAIVASATQQNPMAWDAAASPRASSCPEETGSEPSEDISKMMHLPDSCVTIYRAIAHTRSYSGLASHFKLKSEKAIFL